MPLFDGKRFAETANVVLVTINHRNSALGWLAAHPNFEDADTRGKRQLGPPGSSADAQVVQENIEAFGGDAGRVTLMGQSGGAINSVMIVQDCAEPASGPPPHSSEPSLYRPPRLRRSGRQGGDYRRACRDFLGTSVVGLRDVPAEDWKEPRYPNDRRLWPGADQDRTLLRETGCRWGYASELAARLRPFRPSLSCSAIRATGGVLSDFVEADGPAESHPAPGDSVQPSGRHRLSDAYF